MNRITLTLATVLSLAFTQVTAQDFNKGFNYDYIQARTGTTNSKATDELFIIEVSKSVHENIALRGGLAFRHGDWNLTGRVKEQTSTQITAEAIFHQELTANTDILLSVGYSNTEYKSTCKTIVTGHICTTSSATLNNHEAYGGGLGIRQRLSESIEAELFYAGITTSGNPTVNQVHLSLLKEISDKLSIGANYRWNTNGADFNQSEVVIRRSF